MPTIEVHLYNTLVKYGPGNRPFHLEVAVGAQPADVARHLGIPLTEIFVAWRNGRNLMVALHGPIESGIVLGDGDRLAFSGPVPFSRAYGAPVC
jgi:hypothetical protein